MKTYLDCIQLLRKRFPDERGTVRLQMPIRTSETYCIDAFDIWVGDRYTRVTGPTFAALMLAPDGIEKIVASLGPCPADMPNPVRNEAVILTCVLREILKHGEVGSRYGLWAAKNVYSKCTSLEKLSPSTRDLGIVAEEACKLIEAGLNALPESFWEDGDLEYCFICHRYTWHAKDSQEKGCKWCKGKETT